MPLSEHEQRLLSQMEEQLLADDPRFASTMRGTPRAGGTGRRMAIGATALVVGLVLLVLAVASQVGLWLGIPAFLLMLAGAGYAFTPPRKPSGPVGVVGTDGQTRARPQSRRGGGASSGGFMQRMEQRWQNRRDQRY
ncbi:DUF3040 domain-containing protein [Thalassiella azotivora]